MSPTALLVALLVLFAIGIGLAVWLWVSVAKRSERDE